ncbi:MAG: SDR family oxidoreductase [Xanthomonadales bacterium]|nr:SDR family oxidoreductase [Xanthomonadales bacterium]
MPFPAVVLSAVLLALSWCPATLAEPAPAQKAVLITGATTGLGRAMAEMMAAEGHFVYAGARKDKDMAELNAIQNIQAVRLDVTDQAQIDAAVKTITEAGRGLYGLINNAGVAALFPLVHTPEEEMTFLMDVNLFGPYRVTRAFAPLIIESKGRISTTGSISGIGSGRLYGPYSMSKHAIEAFTDSLALEMEPHGVQVSVIEPGNYESAIGDNFLERMRQQGYASEDSPYKEIYNRIEGWAASDEPDGDPREVAKAAMLAMFEDNPKRRYLVVPNQEQAAWTIRKAIEELAQLNQRHAFSYSRDELVEMLDAALAENP